MPLIKYGLEMIITWVGTVYAMIKNTTVSTIVYWLIMIRILTGVIVGIGVAIYHCGQLVWNLVK